MTDQELAMPGLGGHASPRYSRGIRNEPSASGWASRRTPRLTVGACVVALSACGASKRIVEHPPAPAGAQSVLFVATTRVERFGHLLPIDDARPAVELESDDRLELLAVHLRETLDELDLSEGRLDFSEASDPLATPLPPPLAEHALTDAGWTARASTEQIYYPLPANAELARVELTLRNPSDVSYVDGAKVCIHGRPATCVVEIGGQVALDNVPIGKEQILSFEHPGYEPTALMIAPMDRRTILGGAVWILPKGSIASVAMSGEDPPPGGALHFVAATGALAQEPVAGVEPRLSPESGRALYSGPSAIVAGMTPGDYALRFESARHDCAPSGGGASWPADPGVFRLRVLDGFVTSVNSITCRAP